MNEDYPGDPNDYKYGRSFDYSLWTSKTVLTLTNVTWDNTYRDIVDHTYSRLDRRGVFIHVCHPNR